MKKLEEYLFLITKIVETMQSSSNATISLVLFFVRKLTSHFRSPPTILSQFASIMLQDHVLRWEPLDFFYVKHLC